MAHSQQEVLAGLAELVNDETGITAEAVQMDKSFTDDLDIDSISMMTIVVNAEDKFGVKIPDEVAAIVKIRSYAPGTTITVVVDLPNSGGSKSFKVTLGTAPSM